MTALRLSWWKSGGIDDLVGVLDALMLWLEKWGAWEGHETGAGGLEYAEWGDELHERVDTGWLGRPVFSLALKLKDGEWLYLHLDDTAVSADIQNLTTKLVSKVCDALQVLVL